MDNINVVKETTLTAEKKLLVLVLPYLDSTSLQTRTKLKNSLKASLIFVEIVLKNKTKLGNKYHFKDRSSKDLTSGVVYKFQCRLSDESSHDE